MSSLLYKITNYITTLLGVVFVVMASILYFTQKADIWFLVVGVVIGLFLIYVKNVEARKFILSFIEKLSNGKTGD